MAILRVIRFQFSIRGDGAATSFTFDLSTLPVFFNPPIAGDQALQATFDLSTLKPANVSDVTIDNGGPSISSASVNALGTTISVNFSSPPSASVFNVSGVFEF